MTNFNELVADETRAKKLIEGSHVHGATYQNWYDQRHFISRAIHRSGTLLYIGCANGFLLRCLLEWSPHKLIPYGIEPLEESVQAAKELLEPFEANMIQAAAEQLPHLSKGRLPGSFDFIQWSFWRNWDYTQPHQLANVSECVECGETTRQIDAMFL